MASSRSTKLSSVLATRCLWNNTLEDVQPNPKFRAVWQTLKTVQVAHLTNDEYERYTREENEKALEKYKCDTIEGGDLLAVFGFELLRAIGGREDGPWPFLAVIENVGLGVHPLQVKEEVGDCGAHVRVAYLSERGPLLLDGNEVVGVRDEIWVVPFFHRLLHNGRRGWWGLAFAILKRRGVESGEIVWYFVGNVGRGVRS
eukprot:scaffold20991_cov127-Isochrysis_galbana.AAC.1